MSIGGFRGSEAQIQSMPRHNRVNPALAGIADALRYSIPEPRRWFTIEGQDLTPAAREWIRTAEDAVVRRVDENIIRSLTNPPITQNEADAARFAFIDEWSDELEEEYMQQTTNPPDGEKDDE